MVELFTCTCGLAFKTRGEIRKHIKMCSQVQAAGLTCTRCLDSSYILLPYGESTVCPMCAIFYEKPTIVFDSPLINHMGKKYEEIFRRKAGNLLKHLNIGKLSDMGIVVTLITFSKGIRPFDHYHDPKGELIFIFSKIKQLEEKQKRIFEHVITHETFHAYVSHKLQLGITDNLLKPLSFIESFAGSLAEDIQLDKIAVRRNVKPLIRDEIRRDNLYYKNLSVLSAPQWNTLSDGVKFTSMTSVTYAYATELWFYKTLKVPHTRKQVRKNVRLIRSHYNKWGYPNLAKQIQEIYEEKIAVTKREKQTMYKKILMCCDKWIESQGLNLY